MDRQDIRDYGVDQFIQDHVDDWNNHLQSVDCMTNEYPEWTDYLNEHLRYDGLLKFKE